MGDLIAPHGRVVLEKFNGKVKFVWGNNEAERVGMTRKFGDSSKMELCGGIFEGTLDKLKFFMNRCPRFVELAAKSGEFDVRIYGHTHNYRDETIGETILLNSGEIQGFATGVPGFVIFDTGTASIERIKL